MSLTLNYDNRSAAKSIYSCGSRVRALSKSLIKYHKAREQEHLKETQRKRRIEIWNLRYTDLKSLCDELIRSYKVHLHYLSFSPTEVDSINGHENTAQNQEANAARFMVRSKIFMNITPTYWGKREAEYFQVLDMDGNIIRRPLWIRVATTDDLLTIFSKVYGQQIISSQRPANRHIDNLTQLRSGPVRRPDTDIDFTVRVVLARPFVHENEEVDIDEVDVQPINYNYDKSRFGYHQPMYRSLDNSKYINKVSSTEGSVKITKYIEHCLLSVTPALRYVKKSYCKDQVHYTELFDEDNVLLETERVWMTDDTESIIEWQDSYLFTNNGGNRIYQELTVDSGYDVISTLKTLFFQGAEKIISLFITKQDDYSITIDGSNQARVTVATEQQTPEPAGTKVYKSALTKDKAKCLIEMIIPPNARVASSIHAVGKCRSDRAIPIRIYTVTDDNENDRDNDDDRDNDVDDKVNRKIKVYLSESDKQKAYSFVYESAKDFEYEINKEIHLTGHMFDNSLDDICKPGIHYCLNKKEALDFHYPGIQIADVIQGRL